MAQYSAFDVKSGKVQLKSGDIVSSTKGDYVYVSGDPTSNLSYKKAATVQQQAAQQKLEKVDQSAHDRLDAGTAQFNNIRQAIWRVKDRLQNQPMSGGVASYPLSFVPSPARDNYNDYSQIKSGLTVQNLNDMRQNSPTGGAVGNASDKDMAMLSNMTATLDPNASVQSQLETLQRLEKFMADQEFRHQKSYHSQYGGSMPAPTQQKKNINFSDLPD